MLGWLVHERGIEPHIPVFDKSARTDGPLNGRTLPTAGHGDRLTQTTRGSDSRTSPRNRATKFDDLPAD